MANDQPTPNQLDDWLGPGGSNATLIYILYLCGFVTGISSLIGVVFAYINRGKAEPWVETHYTWAIRTFWMSIVYIVLSFFLMTVLLGFLLLFATVVWFIIRCVIGLQAVSQRQPIKNPQSWLI